MTRIKINQKSVITKLQKWAQGQEIDDELIFYTNEIDQAEIKQKSWDMASMIIDVVPDSVAGFCKIIYKEKL